MSDRLHELHSGKYDDPIGPVVIDDTLLDPAYAPEARVFPEQSCTNCGHATRRLDGYCTPCSDRLYAEEQW